MFKVLINMRIVSFRIFIILLDFILLSQSKIEFTKIEVDSNILQLTWCGENKDIVFALSNKNSLYKLKYNKDKIEDLTINLLNIGRQKLFDNKISHEKVRKQDY